MSTISTFMGFPISTIGTDSGLSWEQNLNAALTVIDQHNHSPGFGQQIQPNGLNISSDLTFQNNNATNLRAARFIPQSAPIPNTGLDVGELYVSGNELYYNDVTGGNQVKITSNGAVNATSSGISSGTASASFSAGVLVVKSSSTSYANIAAQSVLLSNSGNLSNQLTLQAPTLSSSYTVTLPPIPAATAIMTVDTSGNMTGSIPLSGGLTASNLSPTAGIVGTQLSSSAGILGSQLDAAAGIIPPQTDSLTGQYYGVSASSGAFNTSTSGVAMMAGLNSTLVTTRPVFITFLDDKSGATGAGSITTTAGAVVTLSIQQQGPLTLGSVVASFSLSVSNQTVHIPVASLNCIDIHPDGMHPAYRLNVSYVSVNGSVSVTNCIMQLAQV